MAVRFERIPVTVSGSAGSATGSATSTHPIIGEICQIHVVYTSQPATCDVTIATLGASTPVFTLLTLTNNGTTGVYRPHYLIHDETGTALTGVAGGDRHAPYVVDHITVSVAQGDAGSVVVFIIYED